jgi:polyhydroxybutyrate depolymerase
MASRTRFTERLQTMKRLWSIGLLLALILYALPLTAAAQSTTVPTPNNCRNEVLAESIETGFHDETLDFEGRTRIYRLYVPEIYDASEPVPLVISIHGLVSNPNQQARFARWEDFADEHNFIVIYPQGTGLPTRWNAGESPFLDGQIRADDVGFLAELIDQIKSRFCIDPARVFVNGLSNGGGMSNRLACELSGTIAAIGTVAGAYSPLLGGCDPVRPVPVIAFHGTADNIVPYAGSGTDELDLPAVQDWAREWAERNDCDLSAQAVLLDDEISDEISAIRYGNCAADAEVVLYTVQQGGHTWPGGWELPAFIVGRTTQTIDATEIMWDFFQSHPMPVQEQES